MQSLRSRVGVTWRLPPPFSVLISLSRATSSSSSSSGGTGGSNNEGASGGVDDDEWNEAWESSWLPEDVLAQYRAPWEADVHCDNASAEPVVFPSQLDPDTRAFVEEMRENWDHRRVSRKVPDRPSTLPPEKDSLKDYRVRKQGIHSGLWMKEIEKEMEAKLGTPAGRDDIDRLLDSCSEIFDQGSNELNGYKVPSTSEFKTKPEGWETTSKPQDGNVWNLTQREDDILLQEFERRIAFTKFQIASFIKSHIFSRRRPVDGWKYMIEELGPNAKKGKGSVASLPILSDASTQPFREEKTAMNRNTYKVR